MDECFDNELYAKANLKSTAIYAGSTRAFMGSSIGHTEFIRFKPTMGDLDIFVPDESIAHLNCLIDDIDIGSVQMFGKVKSGLNISMLVRIARTPIFQIDFIPAKFINGRPSEWDRFAHSSAWIDTVHGIKGSIHKIALSSLAAIPVMTGYELNAKNEAIRYGELEKFSFSVTSGYREKYKEILPNHYRAVKSKDSVCIQDIDGVFHKLFGTVPNLGELKKFCSFTGLCELIKQFLNDRDTQKFVFHFINRLYGEKSRTLGKTVEDDARVKDPAIDYLRAQFPAAFIPEFEDALAFCKKAFAATEFKDESGVRIRSV